MTPSDPITLQQKPRVHNQVVKGLALGILSGRFQPQTTLPTEVVLCAEFNVSRGALREAVRVLSGKGLVSSRPRVGTVVRSREDWHLLDPDLLTWSMELAPDASFVLSLVEARQAIEPAAARLAALRATQEEVSHMVSLFGEMEKAKEARDFERFNLVDAEFHTTLLTASHNVVFRHLSTTISAALAYSFRLSIAHSHDPGAALVEHGVVIERIRLRDADGAQAAMHQLLNIAAIDLGIVRHAKTGDPIA
ncbi:FadR/GntR family transcriptional regulator [Paraburkholderia sp. JHI869]|uniref:FadR/GntR family transcriptional regulator n=1 Tax=Paraburkholderia sp. JHI869 TaxID=3112959 RepID=UPI00316EC639